MNEADLLHFRERFGIPIGDDRVAEAPFFRPDESSPELRYMRERRALLGGSVPKRIVRAPAIRPKLTEVFEEFAKGTGDRKASTTMVFVKMLAKLLRDKEIGPLVVPIVPDEARTFGMESLFRAVGIYSSIGQLYEPVDMDTLLYYKEAKDGQILEEGITEAGSHVVVHRRGHRLRHARREHDPVLHLLLDVRVPARRRLHLGRGGRAVPRASCSAAPPAGRRSPAKDCSTRTATATCCRSACRPAAPTTPPTRTSSRPSSRTASPGCTATAKPIFYYLTVMNEQYEMPAMPEGVRDGIIKGLYRFRTAADAKASARAQLIGSGAILNEVVKAQGLLEKYGVAADVWSATSYNELYRDAHRAERWNLLHPGEAARVPYVTECLAGTEGVVVAASDYLKSQPDMIARWVGRPVVTLGTDGFGRSEDRTSLRDFFEVDARHIAATTLSTLARDKQIDLKVVKQAFKDLEINPEKVDPTTV